MRFVYAGNIPGQVGEFENTRCASCGALLVERVGYRIRDYRVTPQGTCPECATDVPGLWHGGAYHPQTEPPRGDAGAEDRRTAS